MANFRNETRPLGAVSPDPKNARKHGERQIADLVSAIERFGFVDPIIINPKGRIIGGHARLEAAKRAGLEEVPVRIVEGLNPSQEKALGLALNKLPEASKWDDGILRETLLELQDGDGLDGLGFSDKELQKLLDEPDELEVVSVETGPVADEFWISIRGPLKHQAVMLKRLQDAAKDLPDVAVELGTIPIEE